jgi:hypothetical protein
MSNHTVVLPLESGSKDLSAPRACAEFVAELVRQGVGFEAVAHTRLPQEFGHLPCGYGPALVVKFTGGF